MREQEKIKIPFQVQSSNGIWSVLFGKPVSVCGAW